MHEPHDRPGICDWEDSVMMSAVVQSSFPDYLVIDGGMGTEIRSRIGIKHADPLWGTRAHVTNKDDVMRLHREYLEAGADVIITNSYRPLVQGLMDELCLDREAARDFLRDLASSTCSLRDQFWHSVKHRQPDRVRPLVAGSVGPYGTSVKGDTSDYAGLYMDTTSIKDMVDVFREKVQMLLEGGVDIIAFETIPAIKEAQAMCELMKEFPKAKAWIVYCCKDGEHNGYGEKFRDAVITSLDSTQVVGVGVNCSRPEDVTSLLNEIPDVVRQHKKIVVYPNNGQVFNPNTLKWEGDPNARPLHDYVSDWLKAGANWIGGCCHVTAKDLAHFRREFDKFLQAREEAETEREIFI